MMVYDPETQTLYRNQSEAKKLGLPRVKVAERPVTGIGERAVMDDLPTLVNGEWLRGWTVEALPPTSALVDAERDRRIAAGFTWDGRTFQSDRDSMDNISGAATAAVAYLVQGGDPAEVYWQSPDTPFVWLATDNTSVQMTPAQMIAFGEASLAHKKAHIFAARALKDAASIPADFANDKHWP